MTNHITSDDNASSGSEVSGRVDLSEMSEQEATSATQILLLGTSPVHSLNLPNCSINVDFCNAILENQDLIAKFSNLIELNLSHNQLRDDGVEILCQVLESASRMKYLNLSDNQMGDIGACAVSETFTDLNLESLWMCHNQIRDLGAEALSMLVDESSSLNELYCFDNPFGRRGKDYLRKASDNQRNCRLIWKEHEDESTSCTTETGTSSTSLEPIAAPVPSAAADQTLLERPPPPLSGSPRTSWRRSPINLSREYNFDSILDKLEQEVGVEDPYPVLEEGNVEFSLQQAFLRLHYTDETLKCIDLDQIEQESAVSITSMIGMTSNCVTELCLTNSGLDFNFCSVLKNHHGLRILDLGSNRLGDKGIEVLVNALSETSTLKFLNLSDNQVGDHGACTIAAQAAKSPVLQSLCICENHIGDKGAEALAEASAHLLYLFCWGNLFEYAGKDKLETANHGKLYWVRPFHWELELEAARYLALKDEVARPVAGNLRKTKDVTPTSESYAKARQFLEKNFDPAMLLQRGRLTSVAKPEAEPEIKPVMTRRIISSPQKRVDDKLEQKKAYGESCRNWNTADNKSDDEVHEQPAIKISVSRFSYEGNALGRDSSVDRDEKARKISRETLQQEEDSVSSSSRTRLINQRHNRKRREELQAILSSIETDTEGKTAFLKAASKIRELERRQELAHQYV